MTKKFTRTIALVLVLASLMTTLAFADNSRALEYSDYIDSYVAYVTSPSSGVARVRFDIDAMGTSDKVGVTSIHLQKSADEENWSTIHTFYPDNYPSMLKTNVNHNYGSVQANVTHGYYYRAGVNFYVENDGGSDSRYYTTASKYI